MHPMEAPKIYLLIINCTYKFATQRKGGQKERRKGNWHVGVFYCFCRAFSIILHHLLSNPISHGNNMYLLYDNPAKLHNNVSDSEITRVSCFIKLVFGTTKFSVKPMRFTTMCMAGRGGLASLVLFISENHTKVNVSNYRR